MPFMPNVPLGNGELTYDTICLDVLSNYVQIVVLLPIWHQALTLTKYNLIQPLGTHLIEILHKITTFLFRKMHFKKLQGINVLKAS